MESSEYYTQFDFHNSIMSNAGGTAPNGSDFQGELSYPEILEKVRTRISTKHAKELSLSLTAQEGEQTLRLLIAKALADCHIETLPGEENNRVERIYQDMAGMGLLAQYIRDPKVEEININGYDEIEVIYGDHTEFLKEGFDTPQAAIDIVKKMVRMGGKTIDLSRPNVDSYTADGTRISAMIPPIIPEDRAVAASIRKQTRTDITRGQYLASDACLPDELDFLVLCLTHEISIGIAGAAGTGKTTDENFLMSEYIRLNNDWNDRIYLIEDSREITLNKRQPNGRPNRIVPTVTVDGQKPITMGDLVKEALRYDAKLIIPVEIRDEAAYEAMNAGLTGHTIMTSLHASGARDAYYRILVMCMMAHTQLSETELLKLITKAWPIMCFKKQLRDGSRKIMEIYEATGVENGEVQGRYLYRYTVRKEERDDAGNVMHVAGTHRQVGNISEALFERLIQNGASEQNIRAIFPANKKEENTGCKK